MADEARGYSWPDFEEGNLAAVKHGTRSPRLISEKAAEVRSKLLEHFPYLAEDVFAEAVERYCRAEARAVMLHDHVMQVAEEEGVEAVKAYLWQAADRSEANAAKLAQDCGLDARGHSAIARDLGMARSVAMQFDKRGGAVLGAWVRTPSHPSLRVAHHRAGDDSRFLSASTRLVQWQIALLMRLPLA